MPVFRPVQPDPKVKTVRCSAALLGSITLASRFASERSEDHPEAASRLRKTDSSGASSRLAPHRFRRNSALPAGRDRTFGHLPLPPAVAGSWVRPGPPSRSPAHLAHVFRVAKAKNVGPSLWITGISGTTIGTFASRQLGAAIRLPFLIAPPTSAKCLNPLH